MEGGGEIRDLSSINVRAAFSTVMRIYMNEIPEDQAAFDKTVDMVANTYGITKLYIQSATSYHKLSKFFGPQFGTDFIGIYISGWKDVDIADWNMFVDCILTDKRKIYLDLSHVTGNVDWDKFAEIIPICSMNLSKLILDEKHKEFLPTIIKKLFERPGRVHCELGFSYDTYKKRYGKFIEDVIEQSKEWRHAQMQTEDRCTKIITLHGERI